MYILYIYIYTGLKPQKPELLSPNNYINFLGHFLGCFRLEVSGIQEEYFKCILSKFRRNKLLFNRYTCDWYSHSHMHCTCTCTCNMCTCTHVHIKRHTFLVALRDSSLNPVNDFSKLALIPLGGSTVILLPFCRIGTGNFGLGILVNQIRKSLCTYSMRNRSHDSV